MIYLVWVCRALGAVGRGALVLVRIACPRRVTRFIHAYLLPVLYSRFRPAGRFRTDIAVTHQIQARSSGAQGLPGVTEA
jgi:hypothetical protein